MQENPFLLGDLRIISARLLLRTILNYEQGISLLENQSTSAAEVLRNQLGEAIHALMEELRTRGLEEAVARKVV